MPGHYWLQGTPTLAQDGRLFCRRIQEHQRRGSIQRLLCLRRQPPDVSALLKIVEEWPNDGRAFPSTVFDDLSQKDLCWLTEHFENVPPIFWAEVFDRINRLFSGKEQAADKLLSDTRRLLPESVSLAPVFLMAAEAYSVMKSQRLQLARGRAHSFEHADNLIADIDRFEGALATFERLNRKKPKGQGTGHVHMSEAGLFIEGSRLQAILTDLRRKLEAEKGSIAPALREIRDILEEGIVPGDRHERSIGDRVYHALEGCEKLIELHWKERQRGHQMKALKVFELWDMPISAGRLRQWRLRKEIAPPAN